MSTAADTLGLTQPENVQLIDEKTGQENVQAPEGQENTQEYLEQFVGEGKKYKDVESLAKAYYNVDKHAGIVKQENEEYRQELETLRTKERTIDEIMEAVGKTEPEVIVPPVVQQPNTLDVTSLVEEALAKKEQVKRLDEVRQASKEKLVEAFGEEGAFKTVQQYVQNDPVKDNLVKTLAETDPAGLVSILKTVEQPSTETINTMGVTTAPIRQNASGLEITWSQATELRKSDPEAYKKIQNKINRSAAEAEKLGIDYFAT